MRKLLFTCALASSFFMMSCGQKSNSNIVEQNFEFIQTQMPVAYKAIEDRRAELIAAGELKDGIFEQVVPRTINKDGSLGLVGARDWTCGFFPGLLWYTYEYTQDQKWADAAAKYSAAIEGAKERTNTHDLGFMIYCSFGNGYRLTGNEAFKDVIITACDSLLTRFDPKVGLIRSWDHRTWRYPVIIDNMMNLEMLCEATKMTGNQEYMNVAISHADKTMENHFRDDYSSFHVVDYDENGVAIAHQTAQGYADHTAWARGQGWGLYGYTMMYRETGDQKYLDQANNIANFILSHPRLPEDKVPYWDFDAPGIPDVPRDVSAGALIASALFELGTYTPAKAAEYNEVANTILESITEKYLAAPGEEYGFVTVESTGHHPNNSEISVPLSYADYYFAEALLRKDRLEKTGKVL